MDDSQGTSSLVRNWPLAIAVTLVLLTLASVNMTQALNKRKIDSSFMTAKKYVLPLGCPKSDWIVGEALPIACNVGHYIDEDVTGAAHLPYIPRTAGLHKFEHWLRVGQDALIVDCTQSSLQNACDIKEKLPNRF
jgi:hypothetical protein